MLGASGGRPHALLGKAPTDGDALVEPCERPDVDDPGGAVERLNDDGDRVDEVSAGELVDRAEGPGYDARHEGERCDAVHRQIGEVVNSAKWPGTVCGAHPLGG